mmetsp:Transcript_15295/g.41896  ORF Transcript_15295/g.41896 Transcript_15295/m.41896 type:complete len:260 (-) Transcript_15295:607-1386(-)
MLPGHRSSELISATLRCAPSQPIHAENILALLAFMQHEIGLASRVEILLVLTLLLEGGARSPPLEHFQTKLLFITTAEICRRVHVGQGRADPVGLQGSVAQQGQHSAGRAPVHKAIAHGQEPQVYQDTLSVSPGTLRVSTGFAPDAVSIVGIATVPVFPLEVAHGQCQSRCVACEDGIRSEACHKGRGGVYRIRCHKKTHPARPPKLLLKLCRFFQVHVERQCSLPPFESTLAAAHVDANHLEADELLPDGRDPRLYMG